MGTWTTLEKSDATEMTLKRRALETVEPSKKVVNRNSSIYDLTYPLSIFLKCCSLSPIMNSRIVEGEFFNPTSRYIYFCMLIQSTGDRWTLKKINSSGLFTFLQLCKIIKILKIEYPGSNI